MDKHTKYRKKLERSGITTVTLRVPKHTAEAVKLLCKFLRENNDYTVKVASRIDNSRLKAIDS